MNNTYQPPANFPKSKYSQLPPINDRANSQISHGEAGVGLKITQEKLFPKSLIQIKDDSLSGVFGWSCRIWF